jgi:hypothetical protein
VRSFHELQNFKSIILAAQSQARIL